MAELTITAETPSNGGPSRHMGCKKLQTEQTYAGTRSAKNATSVGGGIDTYQASQYDDGTYWTIARTALFFDSSSLPDNAVISAVILRVRCNAAYTGTAFVVDVVRGRDVSNPVVAADYGRLFNARESFGSLTIDNMVAGTLYDITLNAAGIAAISLSGLTVLALRSRDDIGGIAPTGSQYFLFNQGDISEAHKPRIIVTYTSASPAVQTDAASGITATGATLNGTLTDDGGGALDCGFEWGRTTNYGNTTATQSKTTGQTFSQALTGLLPNTLYHFRALADSTTGADRTFLTLAPVPGDGAAPGPSVVSGLVGGLRHHWEPGKYRLEILLGGYGKAFSTTPFSHYGAADTEAQSEVWKEPVPETDVCERAAEAFNTWMQALRDGRYEEAPALQRIYDRLRQACTLYGSPSSTIAIGQGVAGVHFSAPLNEFRARKPLKPFQPGQTEQAISRLARSPIHQAMASDVAFTAVDHNSISWAAGSIKFSNGISYAIAAGSLDLTATHYIYHVRGDNALWSSTTFSDAIAFDKTLVAVATAVTSPGFARIFMLFGDLKGYFDLADVFDANTILKADADNTPEALAVAEQTLVGRITAGEIAALTTTQIRTLINVEDGADVTDATNVDAAGAVMEGDFGAYSLLAADTIDTPVSVALAASQLIGRKATGGIVALAKADILTIINVVDGADVTGSNPPQAHAASHQDTGGDEISVAGLSGLLADDQHVLDVEVVAVALALAGGVMAGSLDLDGNDLILDANGDTKIVNSTDDQIKIYIANAEDFKFIANAFVALHDSIINTNTIIETTTDNGVTIEGVLLKDSALDAGAGQIKIKTTGADGLRIHRQVSQNWNVNLNFSLLNVASEETVFGKMSTFRTDGTDGAEDGRMSWEVMLDGTLNDAMHLSNTGVLDVDASSGLGAATVGLFDEHDDARLLEQAAGQIDLLCDIGVMERKDTGSGYFLKIQPALYLAYGGIRQNRALIDRVREELHGKIAETRRLIEAKP